MFDTVAGFPVLKTRSALPSQDVELRPNARRLLSTVELVHVEAHSLREAAASGGPRVALLWDVWPADRPPSRGEARAGRVLFPVLFDGRAGPTEEQGEEEVATCACHLIHTHLYHCVIFSSSISQLSVDTLQFLLFLYIQQINRTSLRVSLIGEEWPTCRTSSPSDRQGKTNSQNKVLRYVFKVFSFFFFILSFFIMHLSLLLLGSAELGRSCTPIIYTKPSYWNPGPAGSAKPKVAVWITSRRLPGQWAAGTQTMNLGHAFCRLVRVCQGSTRPAMKKAAKQVSYSVSWPIEIYYEFQS